MHLTESADYLSVSYVRVTRPQSRQSDCGQGSMKLGIEGSITRARAVASGFVHDQLCQKLDAGAYLSKRSRGRLDTTGAALVIDQNLFSSVQHLARPVVEIARVADNGGNVPSLRSRLLAEAQVVHSMSPEARLTHPVVGGQHGFRLAGQQSLVQLLASWMRARRARYRHPSRVPERPGQGTGEPKTG